VLKNRKRPRSFTSTTTPWPPPSPKAASRPSGDNVKVQAGRRTAPGEVEIHDQDTDIFYILEGSGTFVTGGKPVDTRLVSPGKRAKEIIGGEARQLVKGDVIVIPTGIPHWFKRREWAIAVLRR
jgi:quercetin dioxygenase-like cupin family protein